MKAGPGRPNENGLKCHESDKSYIQRKKQTWKVTDEEKDRRRKKTGKFETKSQLLAMAADLYP